MFYIVIFKSSGVLDIDEMSPSGAKLCNHVSLSHVMLISLATYFTHLGFVFLPTPGQFASPFTFAFQAISRALEHISVRILVYLGERLIM